jgi:phage-related baseplate assembly protein
MAVLESISTEKIIADRMQQLVTFWANADPPNSAQYDVGGLEFDPIRINQELNAYYELLLRDRVNQACRAVTLAFAVGSDLDAIGTRYPYGVPRISIANGNTYNETDDAYRLRLWLSPSILSLTGTGQSTFESYVFWALSAPMYAGEDPIKHASALTSPGTGYVYIPILSSTCSNPNMSWSTSPNGQVWTLIPGTVPLPTDNQVNAVQKYITAPNTARKGLTDVVVTMKPKITNTEINVDLLLFPGVDMMTMMGIVAKAVGDLIIAMRWLGADLTILSLDGALSQAGVYDRTVYSPTADCVVNVDGVVNITKATLRYRGTGE